MTTYLTITLNDLILVDMPSIPIYFLVMIVLNVLLLVGLLIFIPYAIERRILSPQKVVIALFSALAWAVGGGIALAFTSETWNYLTEYFYEWDDIMDVYWQIGSAGLLSLLLLGLLAALFGFLALYLLQRKLEQSTP
jgi:hypothetical protein